MAKLCYSVNMIQTLGLLFFILFRVISVNAQQDYKKSVITDPGISKRCEVLTKQRNQKVQHKQRLNALIVRNAKLVKLAPSEKLTVKKKLYKNRRALERELKLTLEKIKFQEENIIRRGCPGITL